MAKHARRTKQSSSRSPWLGLQVFFAAIVTDFRALLDECVSNGAPATFSMVTGLWSVHIYRSDLDTARSKYHER